MAETFKVFGDWAKIDNLFKNIKTAFSEAGQDTLKELGRQGEKFAVNAIKNQTLGWAPLNSKYLTRKISRGESNKILVATSSYFQAITSWVSNRTEVFVGVRRSVKLRNSTGQFLKGKAANPIADIATILEYGSPSRGIPARPLWRPTAEHVAKYERLNRVTHTHLRRKLLPLLK